MMTNLVVANEKTARRRFVLLTLQRKNVDALSVFA